MEKGEHLSFVVKREIVQRLACFETPTQVAKAMKADHGIELSVPRVHFYDPTTKNGAALSDELKTLFAETRKRFLADIDSIPIANKAVRLRHLNRQLEHFSEKNAAPIVVSILEAAAKEVGDAFTNRHKHEHTGKDGKDLPAGPMVTIFQLPDNGRG